MFFTQKPNIWKYFKNPTYIWKYFKMLVSYGSGVENNLPNNLILKPTYFSQGSCESDSIDWVSIELKFPVNLALFVGFLPSDFHPSWQFLSTLSKVAHCFSIFLHEVGAKLLKKNK